MTDGNRRHRALDRQGVDEGGAADGGRSAPRRSVVKWRPSVLGVATWSLAAFLSILALLAWQLGSGNDPALGNGDTPTAAQRERVKRKVIVTRVVHLPPKQAQPVPAPATSSAPVAAAPAPTPQPVAPAPAPAPPAPPVTRSS